MTKDREIGALVRLLAVGDTAFPVGGFSFSDGLESAAVSGLVCDAPSLEQYARTMMHQCLRSDGVAALCAHRSAMSGDFEGVLGADATLVRAKTLSEARLKTLRMGRRLAELSARIIPHQLTTAWHNAVIGEQTAGCYAVGLGVLGAACGLERRELFGVLTFGAMSTVLGAALRMVRVSHFDTLRSLMQLSSEVDVLFDEIDSLGLDDISTFAPVADVLAAVHERGFSRMFMN